MNTLIPSTSTPKSTMSSIQPSESSSESSISPVILETMLLRKYKLLENDYNNTINAFNREEIIIPLREQLKNELELNKLDEINNDIIQEHPKIIHIKKEEPLPLENVNKIKNIMMGIKLNAPSWAASISDNMIVKAASTITKTETVISNNVITDNNQINGDLSPAAKKYLPWTCDSCSYINLSYPTLCEICESINKTYISIPLSHPTSLLPVNQLDKLEEGLRRVMKTNSGKLNQDWQSEIKSYIPKSEKKIIINNNNEKTKLDIPDIIDNIDKKLKPAKKNT